MVLIIGGAYQGKYVFAKEKFCPETETTGEVGTMEDFKNVQLILGFQQFIHRQLESGSTLFDIINLAEEILIANPDVIIDINEVGSGGIVSPEIGVYNYREAVGRISTWLASRAQDVYHVMVGIGLKLK